MYHSVAEQNANYHSLLLHIYHEIKSLGFKVLVVGAGHYPLLDHARAGRRHLPPDPEASADDHLGDDGI